MRAWLIVVLACVPSVAFAQLAEHCDNDVDDDGDGFADCGDPDCVGNASCPLGAAFESTPRACRNHVDDDGDGTADCDDPGCRALSLCVGRRPSEDTLAHCTNGADDDGDHRVDCADDGCAALGACAGERMPPVRFREHEDPRRYPQRHVLQPLTYRSGMLVPELALAFTNEPALLGTSTRLGIGATYGIFDFWQIALLPVAARLSPGAQYEDPAVATTLRLLDHEVVELALYANVAIPVVSFARGLEPLPLAHPLALSRSSDVAQLDLALRVRLHLGDAVRIDVATPVATLVFAQPELEVGLTFPIAIAVQVTDYGYFGIESGAVLLAGALDEPKIPLGLYAGTTIPGSPRGPLVDARIRLAWPTLWDGARPGSTVSADGWQITLDARVLTYLLP